MKTRPKQKAAAQQRRPAFPMLAEATLRGYLAPRLAADAKLDLRPVVAALGVPRRDAKGKLVAPDYARMKVALDAALAPKDGRAVLAQDADVADVQEVISQLDDLAPEIADLVVGGGGADDPDDADPAADPAATPPGDPAADPDPDGDGEVENAEPVAQVMKFLADKLSPEDLDRIKELLGGKDVATDRKDVVTKPAMDAAIDAALKAQAEGFRRMEQAKRDVLPVVGPIQVAMDSADDVYRLAFKRLRLDVAGVEPSAFPAILRAHRQATGSHVAAPAVARDAEPAKPMFGDALARFK